MNIKINHATQKTQRTANHLFTPSHFSLPASRASSGFSETFSSLLRKHFIERKAWNGNNSTAEQTVNMPCSWIKNTNANSLHLSEQSVPRNHSILPCSHEQKMFSLTSLTVHSRTSYILLKQGTFLFHFEHKCTGVSKGTPSDAKCVREILGRRRGAKIRMWGGNDLKLDYKHR